MFEALDPPVPGRSPIELELLLRAGVHADAPPEVLGRLIRVARDGRYPAGATVLAAGDPPRRLVVITDGQVKAGARRLARGTPLGVLDVLLGRPHPETMVAVTAVRTVEIAADDYLAILADHVDVSLALIDKLAEAAHAAAVVARPRLASGVPDLPCVDAVDRLLVIRASAPFARASVQAQARVATDAVTRRLRAGEVLFRRESDRLWLVASGVVRAVAGEPAVTVLAGPGEPVGLAAAFAQPPWLYDAVAASDAVVFGIERELLLDRMEEHVSLPRSIIGYLSWLIAGRDVGG